jgi:terminase large subunit-like protein
LTLLRSPKPAFDVKTTRVRRETAVEAGYDASDTERAQIYEPYGAALELFTCKEREVLLAGPANTGKSRACLQKLDLAAMQRPMRGLICRKVRSTMTQSALVTFNEKVLPVESSGVSFHHEDQEYRYASGARIAVAGLDDPRKILSADYDLIYVQEATELTEVDWGILVSRLRNNVLSYQQIMGDCNPSSPDHWLKARCERGECRLLDSKHEDNPSVTEEYLQALDKLPGFLYQRLRLGLWVAAEGMYFTEWLPEKHLVSAFDPPADWTRWMAVDYGFAVPFCALWFAREPTSGRIYAYRELYGSGFRDEDQARLIVQHNQGDHLAMVVLDPSMFNTRTEQQRPSIAQVYAQNGVNNLASAGIVGGFNNRKQGWSVVRRALAYGDEVAATRRVEPEHLPRLKIMPERCPNLVRTLPTMVVDPLDPEDLADALGHVKTEDHAVDALRYGLAAEAQPDLPVGSLSMRIEAA